MIRIPTLPLLLCLALGAGCSDAGPTEDPSGTAASASSASPRTGEVEADIRDLVNAVTPPPATAGPGQKRAWFARRRDTLERLRLSDHAHGLAALARYRESPDAIHEVRSGLLDIAAHQAPEETLPVLEDLVNTFGDDMAVRTRAAELLPVASPTRALEILEPILRGERSGVSHPADEILLRAWNDAAKRLELDRSELLCLVATDLVREMAVRHLAIKLLGEVPGPRGRQALEELLVESSGNHLLRRFAAQSLRSTLPPDELCPLLRRVRDNEADPAFQIFLDDMVQKTCP